MQPQGGAKREKNAATAAPNRCAQYVLIPLSHLSMRAVRLF